MLMDGKTSRALVISMIIVALLLLLSVSLYAGSFNATSDLPPWEFKGAYANYSQNSSDINIYHTSNLATWHNSSGFPSEMSWKIISLGYGDYSLYLNGPGILPVLGHPYITVNWNSSFLVPKGTQMKYVSLYPDAMPAVNSYVLDDMNSGRTNLTPTEFLPSSVPAAISQTYYDRNGFDMKAYVCSFVYNNSGSIDSIQLVYQTVYFSAMSGLILDIVGNTTTHARVEKVNTSSNTSTYTNYTQYHDYFMSLNSTNIQNGNSTIAPHSSSLTTQAVAIGTLIVAAVISVFVVNRHRKVQLNKN